MTQPTAAPPALLPVIIYDGVTTSDYRNAPSHGPLAFEWVDKPHRLLFDLCKFIEANCAPAAPEPDVRETMDLSTLAKLSTHERARYTTWSSGPAPLLNVYRDVDYINEESPVVFRGSVSDAIQYIDEQVVRVILTAALQSERDAAKATELPDIEIVSAKVHEAWLEQKRDTGVISRCSETGEELMVPYEQLSESAKNLDRRSVEAVYEAIRALASATGRSRS